MLRGIGLFSTNALPIPLPDDDPIISVLASSILGVPTPAWGMIIAFLVFGFIARKTAYGRSVFAIGGNRPPRGSRASAWEGCG
jgi:simple sugar transport system permease protein